MQTGQSVDYPMTATLASLALIAIATSDDNPTALVSVDILSPLGVLVAVREPWEP